ncbi:hypothetical protein BH09CHL1_BH09CHL1_07560 [soil metagenome]
MNRRELGQFSKQIKPALQHQGWLWGKDVRCAEGNRLVAFGFERVPAPVHCSDSVTTYRLQAPDLAITLWSYGVAALAPEWDEAILLERANGEVSALSRASFEEHLWSHDALMDRVRPACDETLRCAPRLFHWIGDFECAVQDSIGIEAREAELTEWRLALRSAASLPPTWFDLANRWTECACGDLDAIPPKQVQNETTNVDEKRVPHQADAENRGYDHHRVDAIAPFLGPIDILQVQPEREFVER